MVLMKNDQFAVYRVDRHSEGRDLWHLSYQEAVSRKLAIRIEHYRQMDIRPLLPGENAIALWKRMKESCEVSDVLVLNQNGEIHCYYVNEDYPQLLSGFIRLNPSGTLVTLDTENYRISGKPGNWMATDDIIIDGKQFYLMEHQEYHRQVAYIIQGLLIPNTWENEFGMPFFDGQFCTSASYMPWYAQVKDGQGYLAICEQPWDAFYYVDHPAEGPYTHIGVRWVPSLGLMRYKRCIRMIFQEDTDYTKICKRYKQYIEEQGKFITLKEKRIKLDVDKLVGAAIIHEGIKTSIANTSIFYDKNNIQNNYSLTTFEERKEEIINYSKLGLEKAYVHLDGWMQDGYDNKHPDALEACKEAGGWEAFRDFIKTLHNLGYAGGIHDQYRDFYFDAKSFSKELACQNCDENITVHQLWAGGKQSYLCASQVLPFVKRNYKNLEEHQIDLDGTYIDVFNCNEGDECYNYKHKMSRKECLDYRMQTFYYLISKGILTSSEEVTDWSLPGVVFAHYAPYNFMMYDQKAKRNGIPVPLFNLVYHECVIIPWMMEKYKDEDYMLYALINGGIPYLKRESSYPNMDGCFGNDVNLSLKERIKRCKIVMDLHKKVAYKELIKHEFIDNDYKKQKSVFSDGTEVVIDLNTNRFYIK